MKLSTQAAGYSTVSNRDYKRMVLYLHFPPTLLLRGADSHDELHILYLTHFVTSFRAEKSDVCELDTSRITFAQFIGQTFESVCE